MFKIPNYRAGTGFLPQNTPKVQVLIQPPPPARIIGQYIPLQSSSLGLNDQANNCLIHFYKRVDSNYYVAWVVCLASQEHLVQESKFVSVRSSILTYVRLFIFRFLTIVINEHWRRLLELLLKLCDVAVQGSLSIRNALWVPFSTQVSGIETPVQARFTVCFG